MDVSLPVIDKYVEQRVDQMVDSGLLREAYDIFYPDADYTRGLCQAIGVREFEDFLKAYISEGSGVTDIEKLKENTILSTSDANPLKQLFQDAVDRVKLNTRRLVRRQKRRLIRLQTLFGWNIHYVDATESLSCFSEALWTANVVKPSIEIIKSYFAKDINVVPDFDDTNDTKGLKLMERDLWTQHICKACGNKVLRGAYEWEQHKKGRNHRKRVCRLRKSGVPGLEEYK